MKEFVTYLEKQSTSPIILSLLKKVVIKKQTDHQYLFVCPNQGVRLFFESKKREINKLYRDFLGFDVELIFSSEDKPKKTLVEQPLPLINYQRQTEDLNAKANLLPNYTFDNFAVSTSNQVAYAAAQNVANNPGKNYNPLFIYGGVGVGKTHLAQAAAHKIIKSNGLTNSVLFCTSEQFTNDLIDLIQKKNTASLRKKYRSLGVLVVDDIQFIAGKNYVQEEFFHTFNTVISRGGQVILTSDRPPAEIQKLEDRLKSRFSGGLLIDIQQPDFELRSAIVLIKARERNININIEAAKKIAENINDARELEGVLLRVFSKNINGGVAITKNQVENEVENQRQNLALKISPALVVDVVSNYYQIRKTEIKSISRKESIATARQVAMYIMRMVLKMKLQEVAVFLRRKDHTTIIHGVEKISHKILTNENFKKEVDTIILNLNR